MSDTSICSVIENCPKLKNLNIGQCYNITDITLIALIKYSKYLISLDIHQIKSLSRGCIHDLLHVRVKALRNVTVDDTQLLPEDFKESHMNLHIILMD